MRSLLTRVTARTRMLSVFVATSLGLMIFLAPSMANASAGTSHESLSSVVYHSTKVLLTKEGGLAAGSIIRIPSGKIVKLPKDWSAMSIADLAAIGIRPSVIAKDAYSRARPESAEGCSGYVCIIIGGSGRTISSWSTTAELPETMCTYAAYWEPTGADLLATGTEVCGEAGGTVYGYYADGSVYHNYNYHACNTWVNIGRKPCEYIHN